MPGSLSNDDAIKALYEQIEWFPRQGIPVLLVPHTSDKWSEAGGYSKIPIGSSLIRFGPRWWAFMYRARGNAVIAFDGNEGTPHTITLTEPDGTPVFDVISVEDELAARRKRQEETRRKADEIRGYVLSECQGLNGQQTAAELAARFGGAASTHAGQLSRGGYGVRRIDGRWQAAWEAS